MARDWEIHVLSSGACRHRLPKQTKAEKRRARGPISRLRFIHLYDDAGNVIETHEHAGDFNES